MKKIKFGIILILFICVICCIYRIYIVNKTFPQRVNCVVEYGTVAEITPGVNMRVVNSNWFSTDEIEDKYAEIWYGEETEEYKVVEVTVEIENDSSEIKNVSLFEIYIESDSHDWNGADADMFALLNKSEMERKLQPGEMVQYTMPYMFIKSNYTKKGWDKIQKMGYYLLYKRYPVKNKWYID